MAMTIKEETQENSRARSLSSKLFKSVLHQRELTTKLRVLDLCSTFDHETAWKQTRKVGNTTYFRQVIEYGDWKGEDHSCTLVYTGKLGSGKSVLLANIVDDLNIHVQNKMTPVAYFFCKHDISESLKARTIIGSLARQLLRTTPDLNMAAHLCDKTALDIETILNELRRALPSNTKAYFVLDGLDECDHSEAEILIQQLQELQKVLVLLLCVSYRVEPRKALELSFEQFIEPSFASIPDVNPEIDAYIDAELTNCLESKKLVIGEPTLKEEIQDALLKGAQGMFLWVALQIQSLCTMKTDLAIRDALVDLPKNLSETFSRILQKSGESGRSYQRRILQLTIVAYRPLTVGELREALSVTPGDAMRHPSKLLNDVHAALACCGCLLVVDEGESTVRFVHHSVKQFLLRDSDVSTKTTFTIDSARRTMADIIVTYLSYGVFGAEVSTMRVPPMAVRSASSRIVCSTLDPSSRAHSLALKYLKSKKQPDLDISRILAEARRPFRSHGEDEFEFLSYAKACWLQNIFYVSGENQAIHDLLVTLIEQSLLKANSINEVDWTPLEEAVHNWHESIVKVLLNSIRADVNSENAQGSTLLMLMARKGKYMIVKLLLQMDNIDVDWKDEDQMTSLSRAAMKGHGMVVELLLEVGEIDVNPKDRYGMTPLMWAARNEHKLVIIMLLKHGGVDVDSRSYSKINSLSWTQTQYETVTRLLFETGKVDVNLRDDHRKTPLWRAIENRDRVVMKLLLGIDKIDVNLIDNDLRTPLLYAIDNGDQALVKLLLGAPKVDVNLKGGVHQLTPLWLAMERGNFAMFKLLLETDKVDFNLKGGFKRLAPLSHAIDIGNFEMFKILLETGKVDVNLKGGLDQRTPLSQLIEKGDLAMIKLLLETGQVDVNSMDDHQTPLLRAVRLGHEAMVELLLEIDAVEINWKDQAQNTPLLLAVTKRHAKIVSMLLQKDKIDVNSKNIFRQTPLFQAVQNNDEEIVTLLLQKNDINLDLGTRYGRLPLTYASEKGYQNIVVMLQNAIESRARDQGLLFNNSLPSLPVGRTDGTDPIDEWRNSRSDVWTYYLVDEVTDSRIDERADDIGGLTDDLNGPTNDSDGLMNDFNKLTDETARLTNRTDGLTDEAGELTNEAGELTDRPDGLANETGELTNEASELTDKPDGLANETGEVPDRQAGRLTDSLIGSMFFLPLSFSFQFLLRSLFLFPLFSILFPFSSQSLNSNHGE